MTRTAVALLPWAIVGVAKALALVWLITDADRLWPRAVALLVLAFGAAVFLAMRRTQRAD